MKLRQQAKPKRSLGLKPSMFYKWEAPAVGSSQNEQDQWILGQFPKEHEGWAIDCGANDGRYFSNSLLLEDNGWNVLCIEADPRYATELKMARRMVAMCAVSDHAQEWADFHCNEGKSASEQSLTPRQAFSLKLRVPVLTLEQLLQIYSFPSLDVLTMDIEGGEMDALKGIDLRKWHPKVIIAEDWSQTTRIDDYLAPFGYKFIEAREFDRMYLHAAV